MAQRLKASRAGKLGSYKAERFENILAFQPYCFLAYPLFLNLDT
jgi:hypothetical protein